MDLKRKVIASTLWTTLEGAGKELLSFAVFLLLARMLNPQAYGLIAIATVFISVMSTLSELGFQKAIVQAPRLSPCSLHSVFCLSLTMGALLYLGIWMSGPVLSAAFGEPELELVIRWLGLLVLMKSLTVVHRGLLVRRFEFKLLALRSIVSILVGGTVGIGMAMQGHTIWALVGQQLSAGMTSVLTLWFSAAWFPQFRFSWPAAKTLLPFSLRVTGSNLLDVANRQSDKLLIAAYLGKTELGAYSIAYKVFGVASRIVLLPLTRVALPAFSQRQDDLPALRSIYYTAVSISSAASLPFFLLILLSVDRLIPALFGAQWSAGIPVLQLLLVSSCINSINSFSSPLLLALGRARTVFRLNVLNVSLNILGLLIAVRWGVVAVALAFAIRSIAMLPADFYFLHRYAEISVKDLLTRMKGQIAGSLSIVLVIAVSNSHLYEFEVWSALAVQYLAASAVYLIVLFIVDRPLYTKTLDLLLIAARRG